MVRLLAALGLLLAGCAREPTYPRHGEAMYVRYCASCDGKGDGPAAALSPPPTDLTKSDLSLAELMKVIDGRRTVRAHGTAAMPVWGRCSSRRPPIRDASIARRCGTCRRWRSTSRRSRHAPGKEGRDAVSERPARAAGSAIGRAS